MGESFSCRTDDFDGSDATWARSNDLRPYSMLSAISLSLRDQLKFCAHRSLVYGNTENWVKVNEGTKSYFRAHEATATRIRGRGGCTVGTS